MLFFFHADIIFQQALDFAIREFGSELAGISRDRIEFRVDVPSTENHRSVLVSEHAWPATVMSLRRYEIVDIRVRPASPEIITYRLGTRMVYVKPAVTYEVS